MTAETGQALKKRLSRALVCQFHPGAVKALPVKPREGDLSTPALPGGGKGLDYVWRLHADH